MFRDGNYKFKTGLRELLRNRSLYYQSSFFHFIFPCFIKSKKKTIKLGTNMYR